MYVILNVVIALPNGYQKDKSDNRTFLATEEIERLAKGLSELGV